MDNNTPNPPADGTPKSPYWEMIDQVTSANAPQREPMHHEPAMKETPRRKKRVLPFAMAGAILASGGAGFGLADAFLSSAQPSTVSHISTNPTSSGNSGSSSSGLGSGYAGSGLGSGSGSSEGGGSYSGVGGGSTSTGNSGSQSSASNASGGPSNASSIATKVDAGLVDINTNLTYEDEEAAGTGMVLTSNGEILTNNHVIEGATSISVTDIGNGKTYKATVVGYDTTQDVAILQLVNASGLTTVSLGDSSSVATGDAVVGIGNAGGVGGTPSYAGGEITGTNKSITASDEGAGTSENLTGLLATNADIEAGDSGGPLVNASGDVVGMDTAGSSSSGGFGFSSSGAASSTQGFAIPINTALSIAKKIESGTSTSLIHIGATAFLGVQIESGDSSGGLGYSNAYGSGTGVGNSSGSATSGAVIAEAISGEPAANAGLVAGDTITSLNGETVADPSSLAKIMANLKSNATVTVGYTNAEGATESTSVTLAAGPPQ